MSCSENGKRLPETIDAGGFLAFVAVGLFGCVSISTLADAKQAEPATNRLVIHADKGTEKINRNIYGHFAEHLGQCIYGGFWVGEDSAIPNTRGIRTDVVEALRKIKIPVLRWPGGCFADEYHWKDGIGPHEKRPSMVNTHWGMVTENNHYGTHEFLDLCEQLGCEPYVAGNVGSGTAKEMQDWVEYMTFGGDSEMARLRRKNGRDKPWKVKYFGVGNENWGCGGNMTPEYYADVYKRFQTYVRSYPGNRIYKVACGPGGWNLRWMEVLMQRAHDKMDAISLHYYVRGTGSWRNKGSATRFDEKEWFALMKNTLRAEELISKNLQIMDKYDLKKRVALFVDEWGTWWDVEPGTNPHFLYQQNTLRDAVSAACFLNIFNSHCDRVKMANIAQTVNVLQAMILTKGEKMTLTPTYHVFEMYKAHHDATMLLIDLQCSDYHFGNESIPGLSVSASRDKLGKIHISLCNLNPSSCAEFACVLEGAKARKVAGRILTAEDMTAHNTFDNPEIVRPGPFDTCELTTDGFTTTLPPKSIVVLEILPAGGG